MTPPERREAIRLHRFEAVESYQKYEAVQVRIEAMEKAARDKFGPQVDGVELRNHQPYKDLCGDRERHMKVATLHALMAMMLKEA